MIEQSVKWIFSLHSCPHTRPPTRPHTYPYISDTRTRV